MFLRVNNIINSKTSEIDYKGLDINLFKPGTQRYDLRGAGYCIIETQETVTGTNEVEIINEIEYEAIAAGLDIVNKPKPTPEQLQIETLQLMVAELGLMVGGGL